MWEMLSLEYSPMNMKQGQEHKTVRLYPSANPIYTFCIINALQYGTLGTFQKKTNA